MAVELSPLDMWILGLLIIGGAVVVASFAHLALTHPRQVVIFLSVGVGSVSLPYLFGWATVRLAEIWGDSDAET